MKKILILFVLTFITINCTAQEKKWEHSVSAGIGLAFDKDKQSGYAVRAGYGLNYYLLPQLAIHSGLAYRQIGEMGLLVGYLDVPVALQYHFAADNNPWSIGIGPVFSYCINNDNYTLDHSVDDTLVGKERFKNVSLGLQPSISYRGNRHLQISLEGYIGLTNVNKKYPQISHSEYLHSVIATIGYVF